MPAVRAQEALQPVVPVVPTQVVLRRRGCQLAAAAALTREARLRQELRRAVREVLLVLAVLLPVREVHLVLAEREPEAPEAMMQAVLRQLVLQQVVPLATLPAVQEEAAARRPSR